MNYSTQSGIDLSESLLSTLGELVGRVDGHDDPERTFTEIARAIDALVLIGHPSAGIEMGAPQ